MKLSILLLLLLLAPLAHAVEITTSTLTCTTGSCQLVTTTGITGLSTYSFNWTSGSDGRMVLTIGISLYGEIARVTTDPGSPAPTDNYDITMNDENGFDTLCGKGANRDTINTESVIPLLGDGTTVDHTVYVNSRLLPDISNAGSAKVGKLIIYLHKVR